MYMFVVALHVVLCLLLILVIVLQPGKGGGVGGAFGGGGSSSVFGPRGPAGLLQRATTFVAVMFMVTSVTLAMYSDKSTLSNANVGDEIERLQMEERAKEQAEGNGSEVGIAVPEGSIEEPPEIEEPEVDEGSASE